MEGLRSALCCGKGVVRDKGLVFMYRSKCDLAGKGRGLLENTKLPARLTVML